MQKVLVSLYSWETNRLCSSDIALSGGDKVIINTDFSNELGIVEKTGVESSEEPKNKVLRLATERDISVYSENEKNKKTYLEYCRKMAQEMKLEMKLIGVAASLDGKQLTFAFSSDGRIDFRELVKNISGKFKKSVRMQQVGSRDEARGLGGFGMCGRELCCVRFKGNMQSITTEMARAQQIAHRGSERISGLCGRLMCCLSYEASQYKEMLKGMPELFSSVKTAEGSGVIIEINAVKQELKVKLENGKYITVKKEELK